VLLLACLRRPNRVLDHHRRFKILSQVIERPFVTILKAQVLLAKGDAAYAARTPGPSPSHDPDTGSARFQGLVAARSYQGVLESFRPMGRYVHAVTDGALELRATLKALRPLAHCEVVSLLQDRVGSDAQEPARRPSDDEAATFARVGLDMSVARTRYTYAVELAFLAEQALEFECARRKDLIRFDYSFRSLFQYNEAARDGGAIFNDAFATVTINTSHFMVNSAGGTTYGGHGGALFNAPAATATVRNSSMTSNHAYSTVSGHGGFGGAIFNFGGTVSVINDGVASNYAHRLVSPGWPRLRGGLRRHAGVVLLRDRAAAAALGAPSEAVAVALRGCESFTAPAATLSERPLVGVRGTPNIAYVAGLRVRSCAPPLPKPGMLMERLATAGERITAPQQQPPDGRAEGAPQGVDGREPRVGAGVENRHLIAHVRRHPPLSRACEARA